MYVIADHLAFEVTIGKKQEPLPLAPGNMAALYIIENTQMHLPQLQLVFNDVQGAVTERYSIGDGTLLGVKLGKLESANDLYPYSFRVFSVPGVAPSAGGQRLILNCFLDNNKFLREVKLGGYADMSSAQALATIAKDCGMRFIGDQTVDGQSWLSTKAPYSHLARHICRHGYVDKRSCMMMGVRLDGTLVYRNIARLAAADPKAVFYHKSVDQVPERVRRKVGDHYYQLFDYQLKSVSGLLNNTLGYGYRMVQSTLDGDTVAHDKVQATRHSNTFDVNSEVYNAVEYVRKSFAPIDCGNTHSNFTVAEYQNRRIASFYSNPIDMLIQDFTDIQLFDPVYIDLIDKSNLTDLSAATGQYFVLAKTRAIIGTRYYEKFKLVSTGKNADPQQERV